MRNFEDENDLTNSLKLFSFLFKYFSDILVPGVTISTTFLFIIPLTVLGSSTCSHIATLWPAFVSLYIYCYMNTRIIFCNLWRSWWSTPGTLTCPLFRTPGTCSKQTQQRTCSQHGGAMAPSWGLSATRAPKDKIQKKRTIIFVVKPTFRARICTILCRNMNTYISNGFPMLRGPLVA